jgi:peroxiredoxin
MKQKSLPSLVTAMVAAWAVAACAVATAREAPTSQEPERKDRSHSAHGEAFNTGPRQLARLMSGIGQVDFPITTKHPQAQVFFNQGMAHVYSFWWYEAERSFRHVVTLDPDCAMGYWGLALSDAGRSPAAGSRAQTFIRMAEERKRHASDRERRYIDAYAALYRRNDRREAPAEYERQMEALILAHPDDVEAKALLGWRMMEATIGRPSGARVAAEALLRDVLTRKPNHPGAHHYRIHLWDSAEGAAALDSCRAYARVVPHVGHAQHMPGHIYAQLGMWHEAARAMDAASRAERRYMFDQGRLPFHTWNYAHNVDYQISNLGYLGRIREGLDEAAELALVPRNGVSVPFGARIGQLRMMVRGERWQGLLNGRTEEASGMMSAWHLYSQGLAHLGLGDLEKASERTSLLDQLVDGDGTSQGMQNDLARCARLELRGRVRVATGEVDAGLEDLRAAVKLYTDRFRYNDPHPYPRPVSEALGWGLLEAGLIRDAEQALRESLRREPNNPYAIALLIEALVRDRRAGSAEAEFNQLMANWRHADPDLPALARLRSQVAKAVDLGPEGARFLRWRPTPWAPPRELQRLGPARWQPFPAAPFEVTGPDGKPIRLADFRGRNLILVFYLGASCEHCMEQLEGFSKHRDELKGMDAEILAVSSDSPEENRKLLERLGDFSLQLASDRDHRAARAYTAFDEFENLELHATVLIDRDGGVWWFRSGSEPFTDFNLLMSELQRMAATATARGSGSRPTPRGAR